MLNLGVKVFTPKILIQIKIILVFNKIALSRKNCDVKYKIVTGSRFPALLGILGKFKFEDYWKIVLAGLAGKNMIKTDFANFRRGH